MLILKSMVRSLRKLTGAWRWLAMACGDPFGGEWRRYVPQPAIEPLTLKDIAGLLEIRPKTEPGIHRIF
jgi:hypothetical protein